MSAGIQKLMRVAVSGFAVSVLAACQVSTQKKAADLKPIEVPAFEQTKPIAFRKIVLKIPRHQPIGKLQTGWLCLPQADLTPSGGRYSLDVDRYNDLFREELERANYTVVGDPDELFGDSDLSQAEFFVAGLIEEIEANVCYPNAGFGDLGTSNAAVYMKVDWQVYDTLRRQVVLRVTTEGSAQTSLSSGGADIAFDNAFSQSAQNLLADARFYRLIGSEHTPGVSPARALPAGIDKSELRMEGGSGLDAELLQRSVAVIRSSLGHGSGFLITQDTLLTNEHVVRSAKKVRVIFGDGIEIEGQIVATEPIRDVALVRVALRGKRPLPLKFSRPDIGEKVYSYGAPLEERFQGTLRAGIVSAFRIIRGLELLQSDVPVNPGNSGGPLLDADGNVIGIAVSGRFDNDAPQGINFFIPIEGAISALDSPGVRRTRDEFVQKDDGGERAGEPEVNEPSRTREIGDTQDTEKEIEKVRNYIETHEEEVRQKLSRFNETNMAVSSNYGFKIKKIHSFEVLKTRKQNSLVLFTIEVGNINDVGGGGTEASQQAFEMQWLGRELEVVGHRKQQLVPTISSF